MDDLRPEIRAAFQKEQAANPPVANLRARIVRAAATQPRQKVSLQWVAAAAALVIGILVVVSLMSSRLAFQVQSPAHGKPTPAATPIAGDYGPPPPGVALFYLDNADHASWFTGFDWTGKPRATLKLPVNEQFVMNLSQSADGSYFIFRPGAKGGSGQFYDRLGKPLSGNGGFAGAEWADDNSHQCGMAVDENTGQWILATQVPGQPAHTVAAIAPYIAGDQSAISALACSFQNTRAVVMRITVSRPTDLWVIQLSDGKVLSHIAYSSADHIATIVASRDAKMIALDSVQSAGFLNEPTGPTTIDTLSNYGLLTKLDPSLGVLAFSADDKTALVTTAPWASGVPTHLAMVDVKTGNVLWRYDGDQLLTDFFVKPTGSGFAVMLQNPSAQLAHPAVQVIVVAGDGTASTPPGNYNRP